MIYAILLNDVVKIGVTKNLNSRLSSFKTTIINPIILAIKPGDYKEEKRLHNIFKEYLITRELFKLNESSLNEIKYEFCKYMDSIKEFDILNLQNINEICTEEYQNKVLDLCLYLEPTNNSILYFADKSKCDSWFKYFATTDTYLQFIRYYKYPNFVQYPLYIEEYFKLHYSDYYSELFIKNLPEFNKYYIIPNIEYKSSVFGKSKYVLYAHDIFVTGTEENKLYEEDTSHVLSSFALRKFFDVLDSLDLIISDIENFSLKITPEDSKIIIDTVFGNNISYSRFLEYFHLKNK